MDVLVEVLSERGMEHFSRFYSCYRGLVIRNDDPEGRGRIQAHCPTVGQAEAPKVWIDPAMAGAGANRGMFWPPEVGDGVFVFFESGSPGKPRCYMGGWYAKKELPAEVKYGSKYPERRGFITRLGHALIFDDTSGSEEVRLTWHKTQTGDKALSDRSVSADRSKGDKTELIFSKDGSWKVVNKDGSYVICDSTNKKVVVQFEKDSKLTLEKGKVEVDSQRINCGASAQEQMVKGTTYRRQQQTMHTSMRTNLQAIGGMMNAIGALMLKAGTSPLLVVLAGDAAGSLAAAAAQFQAVGAQFQAMASAVSSFEGQATSYLSQTTYTK